MKKARKAAVAMILLVTFAIQSIPLVGAAGPLESVENTDTEALESENAGVSDAHEESAEEKYVEDLSTVDWDNVLSNRICLRRNKDVVPDDYEWTVEDFPELDLEDVFDNGYSIYPILKTGGREYLSDAIEKMALRDEFREVKLCHVVEVEPITDEDVQASVESMENMIQEIAARSRTVPNDPKYANQASYLEKIHAPEAWWYSTGSRTIQIGIIDSGIKDIDLGVNLGKGKDFYTNSTDSSVTNDDLTGHGTNVAQIIGALGNNGVGIAGICWNIELIPLQVLISDLPEDDENYGHFCDEAIANAFEYAEEHHIPIVNCSFGNMTEDLTDVYTGNYTGLIVAAAGNDGRELHYPNSSGEGVHHRPSCYEKDNIIAVGGLNAACNAPATSSEWKYGSNYGKDCVDIFAPGTDIYFNKSGNYYKGYGTSYAAPLVTGAAALLLSCYPYLSPVQLKYAIMDGGTPLDTLNGKCVSGKMLNIAGAITLLHDHTKLKVEQTVSNGTYVIGAQQNAFQMLSIDGGSTAAGAQLETYEADGSDGQKFRIAYHSEENGYYTIQNVKSGLYLEAAGGGTTAQTRIQQNIKTGKEEQKWAIIKYPVNVSENRNPTYYIMNKKSFLVMDCKSWSIDNDNPVQLYTWHTDYVTNAKDRNQGFVFLEAEDNLSFKENDLLKIIPKVLADSKTYITNAGENAELQETGTQLCIARSTSGYYKVVDVAAQKVLTLENGSTSKNANLVFAADTNALYQQWQIKHCGDGTVRFLSASTGASIDCASGQSTAGTNIWTYAVNGTDAQRFRLETVKTDRVGASAEYEITMSYDPSNVAVLCASANRPAAVPYTNGAVRYPFSFEYVEAAGYYVIRDKASGQVLTMTGSGDVSFDTYSGAYTQYWILKKCSSTGTAYNLQNVDTGRYLRWSYASGQWSIYSDSEFQSGNNTYRFYLNVRPLVDGEYIIRYKDAPEMAYEADSQRVNGRYTLQFQKYTGEPSQIFKAEFDPCKGAYTFESISHPFYRINSLNQSTNSELGLGSESASQKNPYWNLNLQTNGFYTVTDPSTSGRRWNLGQGNTKIYANLSAGASRYFEFVPVTEEVPTGFYHIALSDNNSQTLGIAEDGSAFIQAGTSVQTFVPVKIYSSYMLVDYASGNALYADEDGSVRQAAIDSNDPAQLWQIKYQRDEKNNLTDRVNLISYLTMGCITAGGEAGGEVKMLPADGRSEQSFILNSSTPRKINIMGDIVLSADSSCDAAPQKETDGSVIEGAPLQRSAWGAEGNRRRTFKMLYDDNGFCKIRDAQSGLVLEEVDKDGMSMVVLNQYNSQSKAQKWIVLTHADGTQTYINAATGRCVTLSGVQASADAFHHTAAQKYRFIEKWDVTQDGTIASDDLLVLRRYLAGNANLTPEQEYAADADDDGMVTAADTLILSRVLAGNIQVTDEDAAAAVWSMALSDNIDYEWLLTCSDEEFLTYLLGEDYASYCIRYREIIE
ncbi:MAG: S8 family serine peptidase [Clostridiales bacterium]|jgi:thermitase|nr:S8 family serine peptidase [Clostridiales bacterium]